MLKEEKDELVTLALKQKQDTLLRKVENSQITFQPRHFQKWINFAMLIVQKYQKYNF